MWVHFLSFQSRAGNFLNKMSYLSFGTFEKSNLSLKASGWVLLFLRCWRISTRRWKLCTIKHRKNKRAWKNDLCKKRYYRPWSQMADWVPLPHPSPGGTLVYQLQGSASKAKFLYPCKEIRLDWESFTQKCPTTQNRFKSLCHLHVR